MVQFEEIIFIGYFFMAEYMIQSHYCAQKSKMAAKIQDSGQKFWMLLTKKLDMALKNSHTKNGACFKSVTGQSIIASTNSSNSRVVIGWQKQQLLLLHLLLPLT